MADNTDTHSSEDDRPTPSTSTGKGQKRKRKAKKLGRKPTLPAGQARTNALNSRAKSMRKLREAEKRERRRLQVEEERRQRVESDTSNSDSNPGDVKDQADNAHVLVAPDPDQMHEASVPAVSPSPSQRVPIQGPIVTFR